MSRLDSLVKDITPILFNNESIDFVSSNVVLKNIDCVGSLFVTSSRLLFLSQEDSFLITLGTIAISAIERATKLQIIKNSDSRLLQIHGKDARTIVFSFRPHTHQRRAVFDLLEQKILYAFFFPWQQNLNAFENQIRISVSTDKHSILSTEYQRIFQNIRNENTKKWRMSELNTNYEMSSTYPSLLVLPTCISDEDVVTASAFRSKGRIPAFCWQHPKTGAVLSRSSQPLAGLMLNSRRSELDEKLVRALNGSDTIKMSIVDARPRKNALANGAMGGGIEHSSNYPFAEVFHLGCENIHVVRESMCRLREYLNIHGNSSLGFHANILRSENAKWTGGNMPGTSSASSHHQETSWNHHIHTLLSGATFIAAKLSLSSSSVLVHCSDGWDRTPSLICTSLLLLDPYYRTFEGFKVLVETHWCAFGHPFSERMGISSQLPDTPSHKPSQYHPSYSSPNLHPTNNGAKITLNSINSSPPLSSPSPSPSPTSSSSIGSSGTHQSPIFFQWLDCVAQLIYLFPCAFEFSTSFLVDLLDNFLGCYFKNFYGNCEKERIEIDYYERAECIWEYMSKQRQFFLYSSPHPSPSPSPVPSFSSSSSSSLHPSLSSQSPPPSSSSSPTNSHSTHLHYNVLYHPSDHDHALLPPAAALTPILIPHFYYRWCFPVKDNNINIYYNQSHLSKHQYSLFQMDDHHHLPYWDVNSHARIKFNSMINHIGSMKTVNERDTDRIQKAESQIESLSHNLEQERKKVEEERKKNTILEKKIQTMENAFNALGRTCQVHPNHPSQFGSDKQNRSSEVIPQSNPIEFPTVSVTSTCLEDHDSLVWHGLNRPAWCFRRETCESPNGACVRNRSGLNELFADFGALNPAKFKENYFRVQK